MKKDSAQRMMITMCKGMAMGMADMIPGVSGGTMAYILHIYQRLLAAIAAFNLSWLKQLFSRNFAKALMSQDWRLIIPLMMGIVLAVIFLTRVIQLPELLRSYPEPVYGLFFGLIGGSIWVLLQSLVWSGRAIPSLTYIAIGVGAGLMLVTMTPHSVPETPLYLFLSGMLAISAMLLPGISGSFILLLLGQYLVILEALSDLDLQILVPFGLGCMAGLVVFSRAVGWLMKQYPQRMTLLICGLLIGTLYAVWPFQAQEYHVIADKETVTRSQPFWPDAWGDMALLAVGLMMLGSAFVVWVSRTANRIDDKIDN